MDFKKIWEGSKIPIIAMLVLTVVTAALGLIPVIGVLIGLLAFVVGLGINFWLGYNGVKQFKFDYVDSAAGGAILGVVNGILSLIIGMALSMAGISASAAAMANTPGGAAVGALAAGIVFAALVTGAIIGTVIAIVVAVIGAAVALNMK